MSQRATVNGTDSHDVFGEEIDALSENWPLDLDSARFISRSQNVDAHADDCNRPLNPNTAEPEKWSTPRKDLNGLFAQTVTLCKGLAYSLESILDKALQHFMDMRNNGGLLTGPGSLGIRLPFIHLAKPALPQSGYKPYGQRPFSANLMGGTTLERELNTLMGQAGNLSDVWRFLQKRLCIGSSPDILMLTGLQFSGQNLMGDALEVLFAQVHQTDPQLFLDPYARTDYANDNYQGGQSQNSKRIVSLTDRRNHLVTTYRHKDTTFANSARELGPDLLNTLGLDPEDPMHLFSVPLLAGNRAIAMVTLGFRELDHFSQGKVSYVYHIREALAQLVWNLLLQERMHRQTQVDNLTGLVNYSCFQQALNVEMERSEREARPLSVLLLDVNKLQQINDSLGHPVGDQAICHLASTLRRLSRGVDTVARYGADEVVVLLPETDVEAALEIAQRYIQVFEITLPDSLYGLTVSAGLATYSVQDSLELDGEASFPAESSKDRLMRQINRAVVLAQYQAAKNQHSVLVTDQDLADVTDKTWLEIQATQVAHRFSQSHAGDRQGVYQELLSILEQKGHLPKLPPPASPNLMLETISSLAGALEAKDRYTRGHSQMVANYAVLLADALELNPEEVENIRLAAFLHDIGKIGIPEAVLCKQGPLDPEEWELMKQHPVIGARQILAPVTGLRDVIPMVEFHHENWDGTGYPSGLVGEQIPLGARIVSIVDAFHGLTSDRCYRKALPLAEAEAILMAGAGIQWDPELLELFFGLVKQASPSSALLAQH